MARAARRTRARTRTEHDLLGDKRVPADAYYGVQTARALENFNLSGVRRKGQYEHCSPNDHVNLSQSTNDSYPTSLHVAIALLNTRLVEELRRLVAAFRRKGREFGGVLKMGRTQLQDAVPMTLGQEFEAWAGSLDNEVETLVRVEHRLLAINMGGTAIGTGLNAAPGFPAACARHLSKLLGRTCRVADDLVEATQDTQPFVLYSSCLKSLAIKASKICNDLRLLASGPRAGLREINLPPLQPGCSCSRSCSTARPRPSRRSCRRAWPWASRRRT
jgi:aspartate ammonia-lyase